MQNAIKKQSESLVIMDSTLMPQGIKSGAAWIASVDAAKRERFLNDLTEGELLALPFLFEFWAPRATVTPKLTPRLTSTPKVTKTATSYFLYLQKVVVYDCIIEVTNNWLRFRSRFRSGDC